MKSAIAALLFSLAAAPVLGQTTASAPQDPKAQALYEFMMARRLESNGDAPGALASLERAKKLDPQSGEISAEIAGYYYRQNKAVEAVASAEEALKLDKDSGEAQSILANVYSAWAEGSAPPPPGQTPTSTRDRAIEHLNAIQGSPPLARNPQPEL